MCALLTRHRGCLVLAGLLAVLSGLPQILLMWDAGSDYRGFIFTFSDEEFYLARLREVYDGHPGMGNPFLYEYKEMPGFFPAVPEVLLAAAGRALGLSAVQVATLSRFLFPALITCLVYSLAYRWFRTRLGALLAAATAIGGTYLGEQPWEIVSALWGHTAWEAHFLGRIVHPHVSWTLLFLYLLLLTRLYSGGRWGSAVAAGGVWGFSFYVYYFTWGFLLAVNAVLAILFLLRGRKDALKGMAIVGLVAILVALPYFLRLRGLLGMEEYAATALRYGAIPTRSPIFLQSYLTWSVLALLFSLLLLRRERVAPLGLIAALFAAGWVALNQQVVTGVVLQPAHYQLTVNIPLALLAAAGLGYRLALGVLGRRAARAAAFALLALVLASGYALQAFAYGEKRETLLERQSWMTVFEWLNTHTERDAVVLTTPTFRGLLPAYTHNNVYLATGYAVEYPYPDDRLQHSLLVQAYLDGVSDAEAGAYFRGFGGWQLLGRYYPAISSDQVLVESLIVEPLVREYEVFRRRGLEGMLKRYRIDYVLWDAEGNPQWRLGQYSFLRPVHSSGAIEVFQVE